MAQLTIKELAINQIWNRPSGQDRNNDPEIINKNNGIGNVFFFEAAGFIG